MSARVFLVAMMAVVAAACGSGSDPAADDGATAGARSSAAPSSGAGFAAWPSSVDLYGLPEPSGDDLGELRDISRDIYDVASRVSGADADLADDLRRFTPPAGRSAQVDAFSADFARALAACTLDRSNAERMAAFAYAVVNADQMAAGDRDRLTRDFGQALTAAGAQASQAAAVTRHIATFGALSPNRP